MAAPIENLIDSEMQGGTQSTPPGTPVQPQADPIGSTIDQEMNQAQYGTPGQQALTGVEGLAKGLVSSPVVALGERALTGMGFSGFTPEDQAGRESANPITSGATETLGLVGPAVASFGASAAARAGLELPEAIGAGAKYLAEHTQGGVLEKIGKAAEPYAAAMGVGGPGSGVLGKIGSAAVRGAVENAAFQTGDETAKLINGDPNESVQTAIPHVGGAALIGGILGGGIGSISSLWRATAGAKAGELLNAVASRVGGIEGVPENPITEMTSKLGMEVKPELQAAASNDPAMREMASVLSQSDTSNAGRSFQKTVEEAHQKAGEVLSQTLGVEPANIPEEVDKYGAGSHSLNTLADEAKERLAPVKAGYEEAAEKFSGKDLEPSMETKQAPDSAHQQALNDAQKDLTQATKEAVSAQKSGDPQAAIEAGAKVQDAQSAVFDAQRLMNNPGTVDMLQEKVAQIANDMKLGLSPDSAASKAVNSIQKDLTNPQFTTLSDLSAYIKKIDEKIPFNPNDREGMDLARKIKGAFRQTEGEVIGSHIGSEEGQEALDKYRATQQSFAREAGIKEELEARLGRLGSTSSYDQRIREMAQERGEKGFDALSGKNNADTLRLLQEHFPKTADAVRQSLVERILSKAKDGETVSANKILSGLEALTPQQRALVVPESSSKRVEAIGDFLDQLKDRTHNGSNTARTLDKLMQYLPGSAVGMVSMLLGHNPVVSLALGQLTKYLGKDAPDAVRLGMLKWMGSNKPVESGAFKAMVDMIHSTMKGDSLMDNSAKSLFKGASKVIPEHLMPSKSDTDNLDKKLQGIKSNPYALQDVAPNAGYYMPNHGIAMTSAATNVSNYMNSIRPGPIKAGPLDEEIEPSDDSKENYQRALEMAQQPMMAIHHLNENTLTPDDVNHLKSLYPQFYSRMSQKLTNAMIDHVSKGNEVPYSMKQSLSTFLGQPMDSSMNYPNVMSNQAAFAPVNAQQQGQSGQPQKKSSVAMRELKHSYRISLDTRSDENA